jgi:glycerol-3-phosphate acyltransferase PlsY
LRCAFREQRPEREVSVRILIAAAAAYVIGSFPTADVVAQIAARRAKEDRAIDLREAGTKNPGALNAAKVLGTTWGLAVLAGDMVKGVIACIVGRRIAGGNGAYAGGIGAVYGHCLPPWSGFRGGKGVATSAGTAVMCFPAYMPFDLALAGASAWLTKGQAGTATYIASGVFTVAATYWHARGLGNLWGPKVTRWLPIYAASTSAIITYKFLTAPSLPEEPVAAAEEASIGETETAVAS